MTAVVVLRQVLPDFVRRKDENRRQRSRECISDFIKHRLRRTSRRITRRERIKSILYDVEVASRKRHGAKLMKPLIDQKEIIGLVGSAHVGDQRNQFGP